jgi:hypothetical protein
VVGSGSALGVDGAVVPVVFFGFGINAPTTPFTTPTVPWIALGIPETNLGACAGAAGLVTVTPPCTPVVSSGAGGVVAVGAAGRGVAVGTGATGTTFCGATGAYDGLAGYT